MTRQDLRGSVVAVTGAARGVGAELARQLAARGARLALLGLEAELLHALAAELPDAAAWPCDVTDEAALEAVAAQVAAHFGRVDVVVVNAGIGGGGPLLLADPDSYDRVLEVNLLGSIRTVRAFLPHVVAARGYVLQVASLAAMVPAPMMSAYCASKSGVEAFAHSLRGELAHHGVDVGVGYLAWTDTDMVRGADAVPGLGEFRAQLPWVFGRTYPLPPSVARIVGGIERRSAHVYAQAWLRALPLARGVLPLLAAQAGRRHAADVERLGAAAGPDASRAVGAGGAADAAARAASGRRSA
jgi:NAD(P)-dependent dehydrogenase (short-subunit alcohol dehydrogenase family)